MAGPPRLKLAHLPTPLEPARRLSEELSGAGLWIKRDDCTGLAAGGNKARKLEYLMAAARDAGADTIMTFGGVQSNHARMTAAAARRLGLDCHLLLAGEPPSEITGNLLLDRLLGATVRFLSLTIADLTAERVEREFAEEEDRLTAAGRKVFRIAAGGSTPLGAVGYCAAFDELLEQVRRESLDPARIIVPFGTGGTLAGLILGNILADRPAKVTGISVAPPGMPESVGIASLADLVIDAANLLGREIELRPGDLHILYEYSGRAYGAPTGACLEAIHLAARAEGILLDPVYTGKAMAGLIDLCRKGEIAPGETAIFLHTGGTPGLFPYAKALTS